MKYYMENMIFLENALLDFDPRAFKSYKIYGLQIYKYNRPNTT